MKKQRPKGLAGASWSALQSRRSRENLAYALAISVYVHWLILALRFGIPALGIPGLIGPQIERPLLRLEMTTQLGEVPKAPAPISESPPLPLSLSRTLPPPGAENQDSATVQRAPGAPLEVRIVRLPEPVATPPALPPPPPQVAQRKPAPKPRKLARKQSPARVLTQKAPVEDTFKVPQPKLVETPSPTPAPAPAPAPEAVAETPPIDQPLLVAEAERLAAESREKEARARKEAEAEIEAKRLAAEQAREQAAALAQAEAARKAEEARRIEASRQEEAKRLALEAEAKANAAEKEAQRIAQETEAKRLIAEAEAKRVALAAEAKRLAQEAEAKRLALEAETKRLALEAETLRRLQETAREQARREAEAAEAAKAQRQAAEQKRVAEEAAKRQAAERQRAAADDAARAERERQAAAQAPGGPGQTPGTAPAPLSGRELAEKALEQIRRPGSLTLDPQKRGIPFALPENPRRRLITKAERDVSLRMYADSWRDKIERHGSFNYRESATWRLHEPVIVTVAIRSDGTLEDVRINRSSGVRELDQAVFRITRLLAPYSAFPPDLARQFDVIEIRRVWSFDRTIRILDEM